MVAEWVTALAASGASAAVGAAATDAWQGTRDRLVWLFRRGGSRRQVSIGDQLDSDAKTLSAAAPADLDQLRRQLLLEWRTRLTDLLAEYSDAAGEHSAVANELRDLIEAVQPHVSVQQQTYVQHNIATNGRIFASQAGDVHYHEGATSSLTQRSDTDETGGSHR